MNKLIALILFGFFVLCMYSDMRMAHQIQRQEMEIRTLQTNQVQLMTTVIYLTEKMTNMVDVIQEKSKWDRQVAERINEQSKAIQELQTNFFQRPIQEMLR